MRNEPLTVQRLVEIKRERLQLEILTDERGLDRVIPSPDISSPGLVLTGFTARFPSKRLQVFGETEVVYLNSLRPEECREALETLFSFGVPGVFITKSQTPPDSMLELAERSSTPVVRSALKTAEFYHRIKPFLEEYFAPTTIMHGSLADVYGVGLLFMGQSGIGKSEAVLDLIERGHRLVADDMVIVSRRGNEVLIGRGHELQRHHMEIRGVGIIDIPRLFGIRAIRLQKRIEVAVQLEPWDEGGVYDRTGLETEAIEVLGVELPKVVIPLNPGKNITVIAEVIAMNHLLKYTGINSAALFNQRLQRHTRGLAEYLEEDYE